MKWFWDHYLRSDIDGQHPYASPMKAQSLEGLPPATVVTCGFDPLRDEGAAYARRLEDEGVDVTHHHYEDAIHGIVNMLVEPMDLTPSRNLIGDITDDLGAAFE
jgi:acetyl esterase